MDELNELLVTVREKSCAFNLEDRRENGDVEKKRVICLPLTAGDLSRLLQDFGTATPAALPEQTMTFRSGAVLRGKSRLILDIIWYGIRRTGKTVEQLERGEFLYSRGQVEVMFYAAQYPMLCEIANRILSISGYSHMRPAIRPEGDTFAVDLYRESGVETIRGTLDDVVTATKAYLAEPRPTAAPIAGA